MPFEGNPENFESKLERFGTSDQVENNTSPEEAARKQLEQVDAPEKILSYEEQQAKFGQSPDDAAERQLNQEQKRKQLQVEIDATNTKLEQIRNELGVKASDETAPSVRRLQEQLQKMDDYVERSSGPSRIIEEADSVNREVEATLKDYPNAETTRNEGEIKIADKQAGEVYYANTAGLERLRDNTKDIKEN